MYSTAKELLILADSGSSNGARAGDWKQGLQEIANETGLRITVAHYPTGASKWNPVEHRLFGPISINWAGEPLVDYSPAGVAHIEDLYRQFAQECLDKVGAEFLANIGTVNVASSSVHSMPSPVPRSGRSLTMAIKLVFSLSRAFVELSTVAPPLMLANACNGLKIVSGRPQPMAT